MRLENAKTGCIIISVVIMPIISYTYTVIRYDVDSIYARSTSVLFTGIVLLLIFTWNYVKDSKTRLMLILFSVAIPTIVNTVGVLAIESNAKLQAYYTVPENYVFVDHDTVKRLGTGFIRSDMYNAIRDENDRLKKGQIMFVLR